MPNIRISKLPDMSNIKSQIIEAENSCEDTDVISWGMQIGVLISIDDARIIVERLSEEY